MTNNRDVNWVVIRNIKQLLTLYYNGFDYSCTHTVYATHRYTFAILLSQMHILENIYIRNHVGPM